MYCHALFGAYAVFPWTDISSYRYISDTHFKNLQWTSDNKVVNYTGQGKAYGLSPKMQEIY